MRRLLLLATFAGCLPLFGGPISTYYLTAGDQNTNWIVQGNTATSSKQAIGGEYPIAVSGGQVRTLGSASGQLHDGALYGLNFAYLGTTYSYPGSSSFYDGTSDGTHNYSVDFATGSVYETNLDWSSPTKLFSTGLGGSNALGIAYDSQNNSLWVSEWQGTHVDDFSLGGVLLSSFNAGHGSITCLAMDPADDTLWLGNQQSMGTFQQFSLTGSLLQTQFYPGMAGINTLGGEFESGSVPEPASGVLLGCALAGLLALRRRRR